MSEEQILQLQDLFLSAGSHTMHVADHAQGRVIINTFLRALRCYNSIGCFTQSNLTLEKEFFDIYSYLQGCGYLHETSSMNLDQFFLEEFEFDFIWIEADPSKKDIACFEQKLQEFEIDRRIAIFKIVAAD